jgi:hypothetical protein
MNKLSFHYSKIENSGIKNNLFYIHLKTYMIPIIIYKSKKIIFNILKF